MSTLGPLFIDLQSTTLLPEEHALIKNPWVGGIILFSRNFKDVAQVTALTQQIRNLRSNIIICVDHEGGRVQRFREGFTAVPPMSVIGQLHHSDPKRALKVAYSYGRIIACELQAVGIDFSFCPVLDLDYGNSQIMATRCFDADPMVVSVLAGAFIDGLASMGMPCVGKHFPGHGYVQADSHVAHPMDDRPLEVIMAKDILPYRNLVSKLTGVMTAHVVYPRVDESIASYSSFWLKNILRKEIGYGGVIFSDDLVMSAANQCALPLRVQAALGAGCDVALICNDREGAVKVLDSLKNETPRDTLRLSSLRGKHFYENYQDEVKRALAEVGSLDFTVSA